ncbi:Zn finger-containing GTPase- Activating Protein for ARF [Pseudocyphellaria aurata]|nr:Zn finger-containing GTPase- Activating Protein for ARF [Pseudocyphellaria aurata]
MQAQNVDEAGKLYDQLAPLGPIMLALTAATPVYKGFLADTDIRWNQHVSGADDRTAEEMGEKPLEKDRWRISKSRWSLNSAYIARDARLRDEYQDPDLVIDPDVKRRLMDGGMDDLLATHLPHLFLRDPLFLHAGGLKFLDLEKTNFFEIFQSTN